jgi:hypothetical protein
VSLEDALCHAKAATITPEEWIKRVRDLRFTGAPVIGTTFPYRYQDTEMWKALTSLYAAAHPAPTPTPPPQPTPPAGQSVFAGKGAFTTSEPAAMNGLNLDWAALQADPEGSLSGYTGKARKCLWEARATQTVVDVCKKEVYPYIGQAENQAELDKCLALDTDGMVAKALVGNAGSWTPNGARKAAAQGWDLIQEWYKNAHPWEASPDAHGYPRFVNVCFGIYSEGDPGGQGYVPNNVRLSEYLSVWHGSYSVWRAEAMTEADRALINA